MEHTKANNVLNFCNDLFFKYTLPVRMRFRVCAQHHHATCYGIKVKESEGMMEGERQLLHRLMETKYQEDCTAWLQLLTEAQLHIVSSLILKCDTLEAAKKN